MSAYIVDKYTIDRILTFLYLKPDGFEHAINRWQDDFFGEVGEVYDTPEKLGQALWQLNIDAVDQRYREQNDILVYDRLNLKPASALQVYKSIQCLLYQCSEGDAPTRPLFRRLRQLQTNIGEAIIEQLPEYDKAKWA